MKLSELVREIIRLGDASRAYWDRELPKHHPRYPVVLAGEHPVRPPPEDAQIESLLRSLSDDQLFTILLLTYVGRGDYSADHLLPAYQDVKEALPSRELAIGHLAANKMLAECLTDAWEELDKRRIDIDSVQLANTVTVS